KSVRCMAARSASSQRYVDALRGVRVKRARRGVDQHRNRKHDAARGGRRYRAAPGRGNVDRAAGRRSVLRGEIDIRIRDDSGSERARGEIRKGGRRDAAMKIDASAYEA